MTWDTSCQSGHLTNRLETSGRLRCDFGSIRTQLWGVFPAKPWKRELQAPDIWILYTICCDWTERLTRSFRCLNRCIRLNLQTNLDIEAPILETKGRTITLAFSGLRVKRTIRNQGFDNHNNRLPLLITASQNALLLLARR